MGRPRRLAREDSDNPSQTNQKPAPLRRGPAFARAGYLSNTSSNQAEAGKSPADLAEPGRDRRNSVAARQAGEKHIAARDAGVRASQAAADPFY